MNEISEKKITVFIPTFNEEVRLAQILKLYDKYAYFVIADNHSTDNTVRVAEEFGAICFKRMNQTGGVSIDTYKKALDLAPTEWIFCGSCSELITKAIFEEFYESVLGSNFKAMYVERQSYTYGARTHRLKAGSAATIGSAVKIFKKEYIDWGSAKIHHETPVLIDPKDLYICKNKCVYHFRSGTPGSVEARHSGYADIEAITNFNIGKRFSVSKMVLSAFWHSFNVYIFNRNIAGFITALYQFQITTNIYTRLWLLEKYSSLDNVDVDTNELRRTLIDAFNNE